MVVEVTKLNVTEAIENFGEPSVWVDVEWGGHRIKSREIRSTTNLNQTFYFQFAIPEKTLRTAEKAVIVDEILQELRTKPEILLTVWADPANDTKEKMCLGAAKVPLSKIADARFQDKTFEDTKTRKKTNF